MAGDRLALGDYVRDVREGKRMTQRQLAAKIGRSRPWVTQLERGTDGVSLEASVLQAIADALEVPPAELLKLSGVALPDAEPGQLQWLAGQLDKHHLRLLLRIGHELLQEQQNQPGVGSPGRAPREPRTSVSPTQ